VFLFREAVKQSGVACNVQVSINGNAAWDRLEKAAAGQETKPDVMVLDLNLPGLSGRQILEKMRAENTLLDLPICVFSGSDDERKVVNEYPPLRLSFEKKTSDLQELRETVKRMLALSRDAD
jgi:CheY-like chemotaxis protein